MKVWITGGNGFVGRNLAAWLGRRHDVLAPRREEVDLLDTAAVERYAQAHHFDVVIHAASEGVGGPAVSDRVFTNNCRMYFNLERCAPGFGRMLFLSSGAVYGREHWQPRMPEEYFGGHIPADEYGFSKYVCARAAAAVGNVYELRLFGLFGPHENWRTRFVSNTCCRALWNMPVLIRRNLAFDYLDIDSLSAIVERFLHCDPAHRQYNICRGSASKLRSIAEGIAAVSGKPISISVEHEDPLEYSGDNSRLLAELGGWRPPQIRESLERIYRWYEQRCGDIDPQQL
jgi:UDP-glucose 4-epimerase